MSFPNHSIEMLKFQVITDLVESIRLEIKNLRKGFQLIAEKARANSQNLISNAKINIRKTEQFLEDELEKFVTEKQIDFKQVQQCYLGKAAEVDALRENTVQEIFNIEERVKKRIYDIEHLRRREIRRLKKYYVFVRYSTSVLNDRYKNRKSEWDVNDRVRQKIMPYGRHFALKKIQLTKIIKQAQLKNDVFFSNLGKRVSEIDENHKEKYNEIIAKYKKCVTDTTSKQ